MAGGGEREVPLEYTPTWVVAAVCSVIVFISLTLERLIHILGKYLKRKNQKPLFEALQKVKEELMLLGFISLLLTVFQNAIARICIHESWTRHMLPCKKEPPEHAETTEHFATFFFSGISGSGRRLLSGGSGDASCHKGKVPLLSLEALHQLHIFIFVLAIVHVVFCVLTMVLGGARIRQWKHWEDSIAKEKYDTEKVLSSKFTNVQQHMFIKEHFKGLGKDSAVRSWLQGKMLLNGIKDGGCRPLALVIVNAVVACVDGAIAAVGFSQVCRANLCVLAVGTSLFIHMEQHLFVVLFAMQ